MHESDAHEPKVMSSQIVAICFVFFLSNSRLPISESMSLLPLSSQANPSSERCCYKTWAEHSQDQSKCKIALFH